MISGFLARSRPAGWLADAALGGRLVAQLPGFLRSTISEAEARGILLRRHAERASDFLALVRRLVYAHPASPYRALLRHAGCEYGDLERLVRVEGLEAALETLFRQGVFLTVAELKARHPVSRGGLRFNVNPGDLRNPTSAYHIPGQTGGSRGPSIALAIACAWSGARPWRRPRARSCTCT